jgi:hypothetical protein
MQSGRPRKPLAEVILRSAPLRATSSGFCISTWHAVCKLFKTQVVGTLDSVGIAHSEKELLRLREGSRRSCVWAAQPSRAELENAIFSGEKLPL